MNEGFGTPVEREEAEKSEEEEPTLLKEQLC